MTLRSQFLSALGCAAVAWMSAGGSAAAATGPVHMQLGATALPPVGYIQFCFRDRAACPGFPSPAKATPSPRRDPLMLGAPTVQRGTFSLRDLDRDLRDDADAAELVLTSSVSAASDEVEGEVAVAGPAIEVRRSHGLTIRILNADALRIRTPRFAALEPASDAGSDGLLVFAEVRDLLARVNDQVNIDVRPRDDYVTTGQAEYWSFPIASNGALYGDCEDYALEKKRRLMEAGVPAAGLNLAVAETRGQLHAVLVATTDEGDFVLDNRSGKLKPWDRTGYRWLSRQVSGDSFEWASVAPAPKA